MPETPSHQQLFHFFNEVGIIQQLASTQFNRVLPDGLHVSHFSVLNHLVRLGDEQTPLALARAFQVTKGTMTNTLAALSSRELIAIEPNQQDRRSKLVYITPAGREFQAQCIEQTAHLLAEIASELPIEQMIAALPMLQQVRAVLDRHRERNPG